MQPLFLFPLSLDPWQTRENSVAIKVMFFREFFHPATDYGLHKGLTSWGRKTNKNIQIIIILRFDIINNDEHFTSFHFYFLFLFLFLEYFYFYENMCFFLHFPQLVFLSLSLSLVFFSAFVENYYEKWSENWRLFWEMLWGFSSLDNLQQQTKSEPLSNNCP